MKQLLLLSLCLFCLYYQLVTSFISAPRLLNQFRTHSLALNVKQSFISESSAKDDLLESVTELIERIGPKLLPDPSLYTAAVLVVSSIYDLQNAQEAIELIHKAIPSLKTLIGCTSGCVIAPGGIKDEPLEMESRAAVALTLLPAGDASFFRYDDAQIKEYIGKPESFALTQTLNTESNDKNPLSIVFATNSCKGDLTQFIEVLTRTGGGGRFGHICGGIASSVTGLHAPKLFSIQTSKDGNGFILEKHLDGVVGLTLRGAQTDLHVTRVVARSTLRVGPVYKVTERRGNEVVALVEEVSYLS